MVKKDFCSMFVWGRVRLYLGIIQMLLSAEGLAMLFTMGPCWQSIVLIAAACSATSTSLALHKRRKGPHLHSASCFERKRRPPAFGGESHVRRKAALATGIVLLCTSCGWQKTTESQVAEEMNKMIARMIPPGAARVSCVTPAVTKYTVVSRCEFELWGTARAYFTWAEGQLESGFHVLNENNSRMVLGRYQNGEEQTLDLAAGPLDSKGIAVHIIYTVDPD